VFLVCDEEYPDGQGGTGQSLEVYGSDVRQGRYTLNRFNSTGNRQTFVGWKTDAGFQWNLTGRRAGIVRLFYTFDDSGVLHFKWENTPGRGGPWTVSSEGEATRIR
jgi:hypothetical protein